MTRSLVLCTLPQEASDFLRRWDYSVIVLPDQVFELIADKCSIPSAPVDLKATADFNCGLREGTQACV